MEERQVLQHRDTHFDIGFLGRGTAARWGLVNHPHHVVLIKLLKRHPRLGIAQDIDPQAIIASTQNAKQNHVNIQFYNSESSINFEADIIVANILSSALSVLAPIIAKACKPHGKIALSGILKEQIEMLTEIYSVWFNLNKPIEREGWILMSGSKKSIS